MYRLLVVVALVAACGDGDDDDSVQLDAPPCESWDFSAAPDVVAEPTLVHPWWVFRPWISKDISSTEDTRAFVQGFRDRDIPVGAVVIDSPWETHYHSFEPNPVRYPDFAELVAELHDDDIRVVVWMTPLMNESSVDLEEGGDVYEGPAPDYGQGQACEFYVNGGQTYFWWKGYGAGVDFFNPHAVTWWHRLQDRALALGIDGWKLDFGEEYLPHDEPLDTFAGPKTLQEYSEAYYRDFLAYSGLVTMVRAYDRSYQFPGRFFARPEHAPVAWMGDNRRDWVGLADAMDHLFRSVDARYIVVGSDIGGYLIRDDENLSTAIPFDGEVFRKWTAVAAMTPFMQLHGQGNFAPWTVPTDVDDTVETYRYWATLHDDLVPMWAALAEVARGGGPNILRTVGGDGDYRFFVGDAFLVAPILAPGGRRDVELPAGAEYHDWWRPEDPPITGGATLEDYDATEPARIPLFVKSGAIIPTRQAVLVFPGAAPSSFDFRMTEGGPLVRVTARRDGATDTLTTDGPLSLRVRSETLPSEVTVDGAVTVAWTYDQTRMVRLDVAAAAEIQLTR